MQFEISLQFLRCVVCFVVLSATTICPALEPSECVILVNQNSPDSIRLGEYYAEQRGVPKDQILALDLPLAEDLARSRYDDYVVPTIRKWLTDNQLHGRVRCLVVLYDFPLRLSSKIPSDEGKALYAQARQALLKGRAMLADITKNLDAIPSRLPAVPLFEKATVTELMPPLAQQLQAAQLAYSAAERRVNAISNAKSQDKARKNLLAHRQALVGARWMGSGGKVDDGRLAQLQSLTRQMIHQPPSLETQQQWMTLVRELDGLSLMCQLLEERCAALSGAETAAAFDSELALLWWNNYDLHRWQHNPLRPERDRDAAARAARTQMLLVSRLDGPNPRTVRRMIDDSIAVERDGLRGIFYLDARGKSLSQETSAYIAFDESLQRTAAWVSERTSLTVRLDDKPSLFPAGSCPDAALYCGWYSIGKYVDAFRWTRGAVGYHVASSEATTLRHAGSQAWCKRMLEAGVAATLGPVDEPFLTAFPSPEEFFPLLLTGKWTLAECYYRAVPHLSWMMILIGDPLYTPFRKNPQVDINQLPRQLAIPNDWMRR